GSIALAAMAVQFVTSGRFETFAGRLGIDVTMAFHKWASYWILAAVVLHPLLYVGGAALTDPGRALERLVGMIGSPRLTTGVAAWLAVVALVALGIFRKSLPVGYEAWRGVHGALAAVAVAGGLHHAVSAGSYAAEPAVRAYWIAVALLVAGSVAILYGLRWRRLHSRPWEISSSSRIGTDLWEIELAPRPGTPPLAFRAGQFVWMSVATRRFPLFDHPFSIASSPLRPTLALVIKEIGDFTRTVGSLKPGTAVGIDGPHGSFTVSGRPASAILLVAGGVGIGPILGILRDLRERRDPRPVRLVYGAGSPDKIVAQDEIAAAADAIDLSAILVSETADPGWTGDTGWIDRPRLERALDGLDRRETLAMICGPDAMITAVADTLVDLGLPMKSVVYERFDYAGGSVAQADRRQAKIFAAVGAALVAAVAAFAWR
ncbi:MAG TPA: ferredoxin reductase family protein, partial [Methylomirabilota bacterium]|nr:ferredoxin reductase family protein [Methylomirabilota bacterium]